MSFRDWLHAMLTHQHDGEDGSSILANPKFGDVAGGNYTEFGTDGGMRSHGGAARYDDINTSIVSGMVAASNAPTWAAFVGNLNQYQFAVNDYIHLSTEEITHEWEEGSEIEPHLHWATGGLDSTDRYVKWEIEFSIASTRSSGGSTKSFSSTTVLTVETLIPANTPSRTHMYSSFGAVSIPGEKVGLCVISRIRRLASAGTAPSANPFALQQGIHISKDTLGSRGRLEKY